MPAKVRKLKGGRYRVSVPGRVTAKATTKAKALRQQKILNAIEHGTWKPTKKKR